jgi:hypothetical protein
MVLAALAAMGLGLTVAATGRAAAPRLLVMDLPYTRVWEGVVQALAGYTLVRASDGVIETARRERAPRLEEGGLERIAERVMVRVEAMAPKVTRITVDVALEGLRGGRWGPIEDDGATARSVLERIRANTIEPG